MKTAFYSGLVVSLLSTTALPAWAEISAPEVLELWRKMGARSGQEITIGSEEMVDNTLVLTDLSSNLVTPEFNLSIRYDWVKMRETGGAVEVTMAPTAQLEITAEPSRGMELIATGTLAQSGMTMVVSGSPDDISIAAGADSYGFNLNSFTIGPMKIDASISLDLTDFDADYSLTFLEDNGMDVAGRYDLGSLDFNFAGTPPEGKEGSASGSLSLQDLNLNFAAILPDLANIERVMEGLMSQGINPLSAFDIDYSGSYGLLTYDINMEAPGIKMASNGSQQSALGRLVISPDVVAYALSLEGGDITVASSEIPFPPVNFKYGVIGADFEVPLTQSDTPNDFTGTVTLRDIEIGDSIWGIFDPNGTLPRDPASAVIDISAKARILTDLMDLKETMGYGKPPVEAISLNLNELLVSFAGAELTGTGAFTFNNDNLELFDGMPQPIGAIDLSLRGAFGLMDKISALGLLPPEASLGVRGIIGAFASPGDEADHFVSKIELTPDGAIMANGQRIR